MALSQKAIILDSMLDPLDFKNRPYLEGLARKRRNAFGVLLLERLALHFWRLFFWVLFFLGLWMLEGPQFFGLIGKSITTLVFLTGLFFLLRRDVRSFSFPETKSIDQRLETGSALLSGSLQSLEDKLANPKKHDTRHLWDIAQKQILKSLPHLHITPPRAILVRQDPYALRFIAVMVFLSGLFIAGPEWSMRVWNGFLPITPKFALAESKSINLWIKPPEYSGAAQIHIIGGATPKDGLSIPQGSEIKARVYSPFGKFIPPYFNAEAMAYIGEGLYSYVGIIQRGSSLMVQQGFYPRARWNFAYIEDTPPVISITQPEKAEDEVKSYEILPNSQMRFFLTVRDDYSVEDLELTLKLDPIVEDYPIGEIFKDQRLVMSAPATDFKISPIYDLTWHTWAGLPVVLSFAAKDHLGQSANLPDIKLTLPERSFENPVAKVLIATRKKLAWSKDYDFMPLSQDLAALLTAPDFFNNNPVAYLAIKTASARLLQSEAMDQTRKMETTKALVNLLWDTAIALEDGSLSLALRDLKDAQKAVEDALRDPDMTDEKMSALMNDLQDKIQNYFAELQKDIQKRMAEGEDFPVISPDESGQMISPESMESFLEQLKSELQSGNKEKAQEMLSQLQRMMDMMDPSMSGPMPKDMQMMSEGINELKELIERQEKLKDQTQTQADLQKLLDQIPKTPKEQKQKDTEIFKKDDFPPAPKQAQSKPLQELNTSKNKSEQEALRYVLGQLMMDAGEHLDEIPESMGKAEQEMRGSEKTLSENNPIESIPHQDKALKYLRESQKELSQKLQKRMQQMIGVGLSGGMRFDPLGRPYGGRGEQDGPTGEDDVKIPDEAQKKRAEEILRLLRDRSGEFQRPQEELEYYRRLLRQF